MVSGNVYSPYTYWVAWDVHFHCDCDVHVLMMQVGSLANNAKFWVNLPTDILSFFYLVTSNYCTSWILLNVLRVRSKLGKTALLFYTPWAWNEPQNTIILEVLPPFNTLQGLL